MAVGVLITLIAAGVTTYWKRYRRGDVRAKYRGIYLQPEDVSPGVTSWRFAVDLMFSVDVKKPIGKPMVDPVYHFVSEQLSNEMQKPQGTKSLPELISEKANDFEKRFPVTVSVEDAV